MLVEELIERLKEFDSDLVVVYLHDMGDGFEDISIPTPMELVRRTDQTMAKEVRGRTLSRYRSVTSGYEKPNIECVAI